MIGRNVEPKIASRILAKTMYRELKKMNFSDSDVINYSKEIIDNLRRDKEYQEEVILRNVA